MICPPDHKHALNSTCYTGHRCTCTPCRDAQTARITNRRKQIAYGRWQPKVVPGDAARAHVLKLLELGLTKRRIAELTGVRDSAIHRLLSGRPLLASTATRIVAIPMSLSARAANTVIDGRGARRRLQALVAMGWSQRRIAEQPGLSVRLVTHWIASETITLDAHRRICRAFEALWDREPPRVSPSDEIHYLRAKATARRHGWLGPLAWDDIDNDGAPATESLAA